MTLSVTSNVYLVYVFIDIKQISCDCCTLRRYVL